MQNTIGVSVSHQKDANSQLTSVLARHKFDTLEKWLWSEETQLLGLREVELGEEIQGRELLRLLLQAHIESRGDGDVGPALQISDCNNSHETSLYTHKRMHMRTIITIFGKVIIKRIGYGAKGKQSIHPLDKQLQLPAKMYSYEIQRRLIKKSVQGPFDEAIDSLHEATGVQAPKRIAENILIEASIDFDSFYASREGDTNKKSGPILVGSIDCKGIPMVKSELGDKNVRRGKGQKAQKKKMATVAAVFTQKPYFRTPEEIIENLFSKEKEQKKEKKKASKPERKRIWASLQASKDYFVKDVYEEMNRRDPRAEKYRVVVTDGERALQLRVGRIMKDVVLILDFLHVLEKLWEAGHAFYGEGNVRAEEFVRKRALNILQGNVSQVVKGIRQMVTKRKIKGKKEKLLLNISGYYYKNKSRMRYNEYLAKGLPIASGSVEGACKNLVKDRMERSGMRWAAKMAEAMLKMRAVYLSRDFEKYWNYHVTMDQERIFQKNSWKPVKTVVPK